jgi:hypothetical protein
MLSGYQLLSKLIGTTSIEYFKNNSDLSPIVVGYLKNKIKSY